jgi:hypothetical protein
MIDMIVSNREVPRNNDLKGADGAFVPALPDEMVQLAATFLRACILVGYEYPA